MLLILIVHFNKKRKRRNYKTGEIEKKRVILFHRCTRAEKARERLVAIRECNVIGIQPTPTSFHVIRIPSVIYKENFLKHSH